jgi:hypothetical protein
VARRDGPFTGREVLVAETARTPFGKSHPERLGTATLLERVG